MRTIAIINQKGGCGKTTTAINLAACLARLGNKTLLVDMDPQGHCAIGLAVPEEQVERSIFDCLGEDGPAVNEIVWQIASDFDLAPSNIKLSAFEQTWAGKPGREDRLLNALSAVQDNYQWCIIDCPPSVGLITFNALRACDEVIVPVETGFFSLHGLAKMMETLELMREQADKDIQIRVLPTLYDTRTKLAREVLSELRAKFRDYLMLSTVNFNTKLKEAASFGQPITEYDPGSRGYKDFVNLARELMGHRPVDIEPSPGERLSRPQELVQRAKQLAQLTNFKFGRTTIPQPETAGANGTAGMAGMSNGSGLSYTGNGVGAMVAEAPAAASVQQHQFAAKVEKTTEQKIEEFYGVKQVNGEVVFAAKFDNAKSVLIAGDFNNWSPMSTPMNPARPGMFVTKLPLRPGRYRYRLIVDGKWMTDPNNAHVEANQFGELDNVVEVG
jgi:chromosome partitioning protein